MSYPIDHMQLSVGDYKKARAFYLKALKPLGWEMMMEFPSARTATHGGLGTEGKPFLWLVQGRKQTPRTHIAFGAKSRAEVDAFYKAALAAGGQDNGPPGVRKHYHPNYYAAFVRDPDGHNIEAVTHTAPARPRRASTTKARTRAAKTKAP